MKIIFGLVGGLAIFIYGMNMMSECLQKAAGEKMKKILALLTKNPILGVLAGALTTAVLQSSSATTVMTIGFVSAGLMSLPQAISIILGANIGTTMTAQIIAFKITDYIYLFIFAGFLLSFISKKEKVKNIGQTIFAFGLLFLGIETMGDVMKPLASSAFFVNMIGKVSHIPILGVCVGAVADDGPSIPEEEKAHIFERFYRTDHAHTDHDHFGLGLCTAQEIVRAHHGKILVHDPRDCSPLPKGFPRDRGVVFTVVLHG